LNQAGTAVSPSTGYLGGLGSPLSMGIDASGNVWVGNNAPVAGASISEFVGLATPANMPLVTGLQNNTVGKRPGTLSILVATLPSAAHGVSYSTQFHGYGAGGSYTWAVTTGQAGLSAIGLNLTTTGVFLGTPSTAGSYPFTITATDTATGATASTSYTLVVS